MKKKKLGRPKKIGPKNVSWSISAPPDIRESLDKLASEMRVSRAVVERVCFKIGIECLSQKVVMVRRGLPPENGNEPKVFGK